MRTIKLAAKLLAFAAIFVSLYVAPNVLFTPPGVALGLLLGASVAWSFDHSIIQANIASARRANPQKFLS